MNNRILLISEYFYPNERTDAFLLTEIMKKLADINNGNIKVLCTSNLEEKEELEFLNEKVIRLKENSLDEKKIVFRILKFIILTIKLSFFALFIIKKDDRVLLTTNPAFLIPVISFFKKFKKFEYTLLIYDVFPENISAAKMMSKTNVMYKIIKKLYDWSYTQADRIIVLGRDMQEVVSKKTKMKVPLHIIENWCDYENVTPLPKFKNKILDDLKIQDKKVFLFAGNLGRVQGIDTLLKVSSLVKNQDFVLLFIGDGIYKNRIINFIDKNENSKVYYGGSFSMAYQNEFLNACDVSIISLSDSMYGLGVPSKSYYNMAAEKPILYIGNKMSEIGQVVNEFKIGWSTESNNPYKLAMLIDEICTQEENYSLIGKRSREVLKEYFSKEIILEKYAALYRETP